MAESDERDTHVPPAQAPAGAGGTAAATERVLLATDGGEAAVSAVRWLAQRAKRQRLDIHVLTVVEPDTVNGQYLVDDLTGHAEEVVERTSRELLRSAPTVRVRTSVRMGDPRTVFESASEDADLLVVGSNHDSSWRGLFGNSFSVKLAEGARCPVVVVPIGWVAAGGAVVVGVQGDSTDEAPITFALREARGSEEGLRVVHVWEMPRIIAARADGKERHDEALHAVVTRLRQENPEVPITGRLVQGDPAESLLMQSNDARLLVVGSHTRTAFDRFFLGSVSRDVLLEPPCAVAVVRPGQRVDRS